MTPDPIKSERSRKSRNKGCGFESDVARKLSAWWGSGPLSFRRTPLSGGWDRSRAAGDLLVPDDFPWSIECKATKTWDLSQLLSGEGALVNFWRQAVTDAAAGSPPRSPVLLLRNRSAGTLLVIRRCDVPADRLGPFPRSIRGQIDGEALYVYRLDALLHDLDPEAIRVRKPCP